MNEIYIIKDWSAVSQVRNKINPDIKASFTTDPEKLVEVLTVYDSSRKDSSSILARIPINQSSWTIDNEKVIELLRSYGFDCTYEGDSPVLTENAFNLLLTYRDLGYKQIVKFSKSVMKRKSVIIADFTKRGCYIDISESDEFSYSDWEFMSPGVVYSIDNLIKSFEEVKSLREVNNP